MVDHNVGKLARWLRLMGYDAVFFTGQDDQQMVTAALAEGRIVLTRDTRIMERRVVTSGRLKALLIRSDRPEVQLRQLVAACHLDSQLHPFTRCLECNQPLAAKTREEVKGRVPPYVYRTQGQYMECPGCHRLYWRGSHWQRMTERLARIGDDAGGLRGHGDEQGAAGGVD